MAAHQAPLSLGFSRQEHWSGLPFPFPIRESESESEVAQSCLTLTDPMDHSLPGSSIHGIFQARVLEWGAIAFSNWEPTSNQFCVSYWGKMVKKIHIWLHRSYNPPVTNGSGDWELVKSNFSSFGMKYKEAWLVLLRNWCLLNQIWWSWIRKIFQDYGSCIIKVE